MLPTCEPGGRLRVTKLARFESQLAGSGEHSLITLDDACRVARAGRI